MHDTVVLHAPPRWRLLLITHTSTQHTRPLQQRNVSLCTSTRRAPAPAPPSDPRHLCHLRKPPRKQPRRHVLAVATHLTPQSGTHPNQTTPTLRRSLSLSLSVSVSVSGSVSSGSGSGGFGRCRQRGRKPSPRVESRGVIRREAGRRPVQPRALGVVALGEV
jgi:hypothetical protein